MSVFSSKDEDGDQNTHVDGHLELEAGKEIRIGGVPATTASIAPAVITGKPLTGFVASTNTAVIATDTILEAFQKIQAQINALNA